MPRKPDYRKARFDQIEDPGEFALRFSHSVVQATTISMGMSDIEAFVDTIARLSGRFMDVQRKVNVDLARFNVGGRPCHEVDHVWTTATAIRLVNSKSGTRSNTEDPALTVKFYVAARNAVQQTHPSKLVTYEMLMLNVSKSVPVYEANGITTLDMNQHLTELRGAEVNIEKEQKIQRHARYRQSARKLCKAIDRPESYGIEVLSRFGL
jgi:hypothetical protein